MDFRRDTANTGVDSKWQRIPIDVMRVAGQSDVRHVREGSIREEGGKAGPELPPGMC